MDEGLGMGEPGEDPRIINLPEAAKIIGCSRSTAWRLARDGELAAFRVRNIWKTSTAACEKYMRDCRLDQVMACRMKKGR